MLHALRYRTQIPLGLSIAVVFAAALVTLVSAQWTARNAREDSRARVERGLVLLKSQARPLLGADDVWRAFQLVRDVATLLPGADLGHSLVAVLDRGGTVFAASSPLRLEIGEPVLGAELFGRTLPAVDSVVASRWIGSDDEGIVLLDPIRSDDGGVIGFALIAIEPAVFEPDWVRALQPALLGSALAIALLIPIGWWTGSRMAHPVMRVAEFIDRIGQAPPATLVDQVPAHADPELARIGSAVRGLLMEMARREDAEARAVSAERLATVGRMTAAVAHEINNPLGGLLTAVSTLRRHGDDSGARDRTLDLIERGLHQIQATVAALLPQARAQQRAFASTDFDDILTLVSPQAQRQGVQINARLDVCAPVLVEAFLLRQVMLNLLLNALKATGGAGTIRLTLHADAAEVRVEVCNSGAAFTQEMLTARIGAESGNDPRGFGLWICREYANEMHGRFGIVEGAADMTCIAFVVPNRKDDGKTAIN